MNVVGGNNGTTSSTGVNPEFPPNGATKGGAGTSGAVLLNNIVINAANTTICTGQAATLTATLGGNPPGGTTITWYDALVGGNVLPSSNYVCNCHGRNIYLLRWDLSRHISSTCTRNSK
jgi:hypothetical protein